MVDMLLTEIEWDCRTVLAHSLPQRVLVLDCPKEQEPDTETFQTFIRSRFGAGTLGCAGYDVRELGSVRLDHVTVVRWS